VGRSGFFTWKGFGIAASEKGMLKVEVMGVSLKTEKRRSQCPVFSFRPRVRRTNDVRWRAEGLPGMTTEDLHGNDRRSAPPAGPPLVCIAIPDHSSFSVLRETHMAFACGYFKELKCCELQENQNP